MLILGAKGMLGHDLAEEFKEYDPVLWDKEECDITNETKTLELILELSPEIIINAAAYTNVDGAEDDQEIADSINHMAVKYISQAAKKVGAVLIHISTEYVFDGENHNGYNEEYSPQPLSVYGQTKFAGEQVLVDSRCKYYLVRTSWLYGKAPQKGKPRGKNFIDTIIEKANSGGELKVVNDQFGRPTFAKDLAQQIHYLIKNKLDFGIYHITNNGQASWYELAKYALQVKGIDVKIKPCQTGDFIVKAARPKYSILNNSKLPELRNWQQAVKEYLK